MVRYTQGTHNSRDSLTQAYTPRLGNRSLVFRTFGTLAKAISWHHRLCQGCIPQCGDDPLVFVDSTHFLR